MSIQKIKTIPAKKDENLDPTLNFHESDTESEIFCQEIKIQLFKSLL